MDMVMAMVAMIIILMVPKAKKMMLHKAQSVLLGGIMVLFGTALLMDIFSPEVKIAQVNLLSKTELVRHIAKWPLDNSYVDALARLADSKAEAAELFTLAAKRNWRDSEAQTHVIDGFVAAEKFSAALVHIDALLKVHSEMRPRLFALVFAMMNNAESLASVVDGLVKQPPWRKKFVDYVAGQENSTAMLVQLSSDLKTKHSGFSSDEVSGALKILVDGKHVTEANLFWLDSLNANQLTHANLIYDGKFDEPLGNHYFDWTVTHTAEFDVGLAERSDNTGNHALAVKFFGRIANINIVSQTLVLAPGHYHFKANVNADHLRSDGEVVWQMRCMDKTAAIGAAEISQNISHWDVVDFKFEIPAQNCSFQKLVLRPKNSGAMFAGTIYFDDIMLEANNADGA
jgi:hypothetical protein